MLGNIQPKFRSKLKGIKLIGLCKQKHVKKYGMNVILQRLIEDIKELVSIQVTYNIIFQKGH